MAVRSYVTRNANIAHIAKQIDQIPLRTPGSLVWDQSSQSLFISTNTRWVKVGSSPDEISGSVQVSASRAISDSVKATNIQAFKFLQMPSTPSISSFPLQEPGGIILARDVSRVYVSTATAWIPLATGSTTTLTSVGGGESLISSFVSPNYNIKSLIAGTGITITPDFANTTLTIASTGGIVDSITAGPGISVTGTATNPIVNNTGVISVTAGPGITITGTASNPIVNASGVVFSITAGPGISITGTATNPVVNNIVTLSSEPTGVSTYSIVSTGSVNPTPLRTKTITAGSNITIVDTGTDLTISSITSPTAGFSAMKSGTQVFNYVGPQPVGGTIVGWTTAGAFNGDTIGGFNPVTGVFTAPTTSLYSITASVILTPNTNQNSYYLILRVNGVTDAYRTEDQPASTITLRTTLRLNTNAFLTLGDTVEVFVSNTVAVSGSSFTVSGSPDTWFSILRL